MTYTIDATAIRVFYGFKNASLTNDAFFSVVGSTFMPGTPYMLQRLGLASYTSGVLKDVADPLVPVEFALIGYASPETYHYATSQTLQGRMYGQTHGGVYDLPRSHASFPVDLQHLPEAATDPFFTWGSKTDWQQGRTAVFAARKHDGVAPGEFRSRIRAAVHQVDQGQNDLLICLPEDHFVILWAHSSADAAAPPDWSAFHDFAEPLLSTVATRALWSGEEPPPQVFTASTAVNWIFVREERLFLR
jgi:hypothetical protein